MRGCSPRSPAVMGLLPSSMTTLALPGATGRCIASAVPTRRVRDSTSATGRRRADLRGDQSLTLRARPASASVRSRIGPGMHSSVGLDRAVRRPLGPTANWGHPGAPVIHADAEPIHELAAQPAGHERKDDPANDKNKGQRPRPFGVPHRRNQLAAKSTTTTTFQRRARGRGLPGCRRGSPASRSGRNRRRQPADDPGGDEVIGHARPGAVPAARAMKSKITAVARGPAGRR